MAKEIKTRISLKVRAGAARTAFSGRLGDAWKLQVAAPPVDGKANDAILKFLAKLAGVPNANVQIVGGASNPSKVVEIHGITSEDLERAILESHGPRTHSGSSSASKS